MKRMATDHRPLVEFGWLRALIYVMLSLAIISLVQVALAFMRFASLGTDGPNSMSAFGFYGVVTVVMVGMAFLFRRFIDRKPITSLGFQWRGYRSQAASGFFLGVLILATGSLILVMTGTLYFTGMRWNPQDQFFSFVLFVTVAFTEEIAFRGYILSNLLESTHKWAALLISAIAFALFHSLNQHITLIAMLNIFVAGVLLGLNYIFTRNLWFAIFLHFSWNYFQGPVLGYEVSGISLPGILEQASKGPDYLTGGAFGFEGSIVCLALITLATALLASYYAGYRTRHKPGFNH